VSFDTHLNSLLAQLLAKPGERISNESLIHCMDLTLLSENSSNKSLLHLNKLANQHQVAAVCVFPNDLTHFKLNNHIHIATVINFPKGDDDINSCLRTIDQAKQLGAQEIDYVAPYAVYLEGNKKNSVGHAALIARHCKDQRLTLKIILETGAFSELRMLYEFSRDLLELDVDFLKTSTGKIPQGASLAAVFALLTAIKDSEKACGIKISGGVKSPEQARGYACLAEHILEKKISNHWFRIGASSLLEELLKTASSN
jgi:deoxyribose-phosphate aldolase